MVLDLGWSLLKTSCNNLMDKLTSQVITMKEVNLHLISDYQIMNAYPLNLQFSRISNIDGSPICWMMISTAKETSKV